ncbi:MAG: PQQ-binding-like beta-propeller repeat protein [Phycisphaerales bacterium]|nr:PQQ-like beta-propeller repeat protein [Phycisphaerae bacterium]NNF42901.1 PQQ-binding-like beta-propeller repeat protein [Phycisphaerales bacterium]NNM26287.1 PQQ-binding-like beta-propeller repeat protein [Phycisphaerales bacterium]
MSKIPLCYRILFLLLPVLGFVATSPGQLGNPVYVDDSPQAWELIQLARAQASENEGEAIRIYQELLDDYGTKLIPLHPATDDEFVSVRDHVLAELMASDALLDRHRLMESAEATRLLEAREYIELARTRPLTAPGLEALLWCGQDALESGRFQTAASWLEPAITHPDLTARQAAHAWFMLGMAAHYAGIDGQRRQALAALTELGSPGGECRRELERLVALDVPTPADSGATTLERTTTTDLEDLVAQTIWSAPLDDALIHRRFGERSTSRAPGSTSFERKQRQGELTTTTPTVVDNLVYTNEGHTIRALDRYTGRTIWTWTQVQRRRQSGPSNDSDQAGDLNVVTVSGDDLVTLTGHAFTATRSDDGQVVCLDAVTGDFRWARSLQRIGDDREFDGLFPHGAPIVAEGRVFLLARRVTKQLLTGCYVVALDLATGELSWIRHLASSGSRSRSPRPFSSIVHRDRDVYVATAIGAIACLDAATGTTRWLRRYSVPVTVRSQERRPWEFGGPVVTDEHVIAVTPDQRSVVVIDRQSGDELRTHNAWPRGTWNSPRYLVASDRYLYAVGTEIRAFPLVALDQPQWSLPAPAESRLGGLLDEPVPGTPMIEPPTLVGRVQLADHALVVPTLSGLLLVDPETGVTLNQLEVERAGNPVAVGSQLFVSGANRLDVYMSLGRAEQMLRQRIASNPTDSEPALSLLQLGVRVDDLTLALEGAELALAAIRDTGAETPTAVARRELFGMLLEIHERRIARTHEEQAALYAMIGAVATTAEQRVEYYLAYGDGVGERDPGEAARSYQRILDRSVLAGTVRGQAGLLRPAGVWAAERLATLIETHGPSVYADASAQAAATLARLEGHASPDPAELLTLAAKAPFAPAGVTAALRAAEIKRAAGDDRGALAALAGAYHLAPRSDRGDRLLGAFVATLADQGDDASARAVLEEVIATRDDARLLTATGPRVATDWRDTFAPGRVERRSRLGRTPRTARVMPGRLLPAAAGVTPVGTPSTAFLLEGEHLTRLEGSTIGPRWTVTLDAPGAQLLAADERSVLLWMGEQTDDPRVVALDPQTGRARWTTPPLREHLDEPLSRDRGAIAQMPNGLPFDPRETLVRLGDELAFLIQRTGGVVAARPSAAGAIAWSLDRTLEQVHIAEAHPFGLILAGIGRTPAPDGTTGELVPQIVVLANETGDVLHRIRPQSPGGVTWMTATPMGRVVCATPEAIELIDILRGRAIWTNLSYAAMETRRGWPAEGHVVIESPTSSLHTLDLTSGVISEAFDTNARGSWERDTLRAVRFADGQIVTRYSERMICYDLTGAIIGADVIDEPRDYRALLFAEDRLVLVSQFESRQVQVQDDGTRRTQRKYRLYVLSPNGRLEMPVIEIPPIAQRVRDAAVIDGGVLLSTNSETIVVPFEN